MEKVITSKDDTPVSMALKYALENYQRPRGKPPTTWISTVKKDLTEIGTTWVEACDVIKRDQKEWMRILARL